MITLSKEMEHISTLISDNKGKASSKSSPSIPDQGFLLNNRSIIPSLYWPMPPAPIAVK
jgi:hypothetical protein